MEGDGIIEQYAGGYDDYLLQKQDTLNKGFQTRETDKRILRYVSLKKLRVREF
jgi:hypothetical protein